MARKIVFQVNINNQGNFLVSATFSPEKMADTIDTDTSSHQYKKQSRSDDNFGT